MSKKKHFKKHHFRYADPESVGVAEVRNDTEKTEKIATSAPTKEHVNIKKDLKKTVIVIGLFIIVIIALFFIQEKTNLLNPLLKRFGI